ncbi:MAG: hypothetical protein AB7O48_03560 [Cyclobacteriaceae bacterium]
MELEVFTLADFAADYGNGKLTVVGTFDTLFAPKLPAIHPHCAVAVRLRIANKDAGRHDFELRALSPDGEVLHSAKGGLDLKPNPNAEYNTFNLVMNIVNLKLGKAGVFAFEFHFNDEFRSGLKMNVVHALPPGMTKAA